MVKLTLLYPLQADAATFDAYYRSTHIPLVKALPDLRRIEIAGITAARGGGPAEHHLVAELWFDDGETMAAAFQSQEGNAVVADVENFAPGGSTGFVSTVWETI